MSDTPTNRRRYILRPTFSLRAFLVLVTVLAAVIGIRVRQAQQQKQAVDTITQFGGWVRYDYQIDDDGKFDADAKPWGLQAIRERIGIDFVHSVVEVNLTYSEDEGPRQDNSNIAEAPLECLLSLPRLRALYLHEEQASDANLKYVGQLRRLETIMIWDALNVTDIGAAELKSCSNLKYIHLSDSQITDESLRTFAELPKLEGLSLQFNQFTDAGVRHLKKLKHLKSLWVCGKDERPNDISNDSLQFLLELPEFSRLGVQSTKVTSEFEDALTKKFANARVSR